MNSWHPTDSRGSSSRWTVQDIEMSRTVIIIVVGFAAADECFVKPHSSYIAAYGTVNVDSCKLFHVLIT